MCVCVSITVLCIPQGHYKVVRYLVEHVSQFPSDADLNRYINTLSDKVHIHKGYINDNNNYCISQMR